MKQSCSFEQNWNPFTLGCFMQSLYYLPLEKGMTLQIKKNPDFSLPKNAFCQVLKKIGPVFLEKEIFK